ncbi:hypothetical protein CJU35_32055 [Pseudomonas aeruginosa]|nr:hypothetical protein CJU35_32055 [Pseudomonas aeruginosa]RPW75137.1 hypothetical protein IPC736_29835 [Pseudomonas aeruginosa]
MEVAKAVSKGGNAEAALEGVLQKPIRVIVDEFQRMVDTSSGNPSPRIAAFIEKVSKRAAPGRLLLLSHYCLDRTTRWGERVAFKTLEGLSPCEGAELLGQLLENSKRQADIPHERRPEISRWLGGNPRAIRVLVGCLEQEALDDLTGVVPEAWEARDQDVSESLISKLERELLIRALENLDGASASALAGVSVYRKPVDGDGITKLLPAGLPLSDFCTALTARFLLQQRAGWYTLNPVVREISLRRLKVSQRAAQTAHSAAAGYYTRHFTARQISNAGTLGGAFVEARYHLVQADKLGELSEIAQRFGHHLKLIYGWTTPTTRNVERRDEVIGVLSAYLQEGGPKSMEYHLAKLLIARGHAGDLQRALDHARRSTGQQSPADAWILRIRLEAQVVGIESMMAAVRRALEIIPVDAGLNDVYVVTAEQLAINGQENVAVELLSQGVKRIPPDKGLCAIYIALADLLSKIGEKEEAILVLRNGLVTIPAQFNLFSLYIRIAPLLVAKGELNTAVELLQDGISRVPPKQNLAVIYLALASILEEDGQLENAKSTLDEGLHRIPTGHQRSELQSSYERLLDDVASSAPTSDVAVASSAPAKVDEDGFRHRQLNILVVGTEWESRHGGLSTLNRNLCIELASVGHRVVCLVPEASGQELENAKQAGVLLINPHAEPGLEGTERLLLDAPLPTGFIPDFVIGHDRKTGPHANVLAQKFENAKFVFFVHTRPENIEWYKDKLGADDSATSAEDRRLLQSRLAASAALIVGVGPTLTLKARSDVYLLDPAPLVHRLDPGFYAVSRPNQLPPEFICLLLGRADDFKLKGLDIAAKALGEVSRRGKLPVQPRLIVRGAPVGTGQDLRDQLVQLSGGKLDVEIRNYSEQMDLLQKDIQTASLVLMPSRSEGFGLVALEAIAAKTPVLVSDRSGIASMLRELLPEVAQQLLVETQDDLESSAKEWERSIEAILMDRSAAFARAEALQAKMGDFLDWKKAIRSLEKAWAPLLDTRAQNS